MTYRLKNIPLYCHVGKKRFHFNLNHYRNAHYQVLNRAKRWFEGWVLIQNTKAKRFKTPVEIHYQFWLTRKSDLMNYGAVVDKFLQDALIKKRIIQDDNVDIVKHISFDFCGYDKVGRASVEVRQWKGAAEIRRTF